ncbi:riboflavin kinase [Microbacterium mangrovi]|uniref:Riboflavin biosynthesis protein n=1 Tax=Microbacterium mangrovi TaxID=1348253 RepID=A0A0B1ZYA5_9MICO|nr:bifunctional riboflavin kinase/FAD synthetase [Microbacterium mangrovi]KHK96205.1 riboflavin kinase [Microbacterium mangrovi]
MIVFDAPEAVPADFGPSVVAVGKFDGVHAGHRALLQRARQDAERLGAKVVAVTFDRNPLRTVRPEICPDDVIGPSQKLDLLAEAGADATLLLRFDQQRAAQEASEFISEVLVDALHAKVVLVGRDFRFGHRGAGDVALLESAGAQAGFTVDVVGDIRPDSAERRVSSTWVRELVAAGDVAGATTLLGRAPSVRGDVVHGLKRGRELGYPTANIGGEVEGLIPADGVYAGWLVDGAARYPAAISVGTNPTFDDVHHRQVEAYVLDRDDLDLYDHRVDVEFTERIRGMVAFDGIGPLLAQMADDVQRARGILA